MRAVDDLPTWPGPDRRVGGATRVSNRWAVLAVVLAGLFTVSVTITLLAVSLVDIADDLGSTPGVLSWTIAGPMLAFGIVGPAAGKAGDLFGHKRLFLIGLVGAGVFALLTAFAWSALSLIAFRTLSASFGAATGPAAVAMINRHFDAGERVRALGYWSFVGAGAPVLGVVLGGPLVDAVGWRVIFLTQAPLCVAGALVAWRLLPETERGVPSRFDWAGAVLLSVGVTSFLVAVNRGADWGWTSPAVLGLFALAPAALATFVQVERRVPEPLLPLHWLSRRNVTAPVASGTLTNFAYMGGFILTPVLLERGLGFTTAAVGLLIIARPLAFALTAPTAPPLTIRLGERVAGVVGAVVVTASMVGLAAIGRDTAPWFIMAALALSGIGLGVSSPALGATVANAVEETDFGVAGAVQQLLNQVGAVVGVQVMQTVQQATAGAGFVEGFRAAYLVGAGVALLGAVAAAFIVPRRAEAPSGADERVEPALA